MTLPGLEFHQQSLLGLMPKPRIVGLDWDSFLVFGGCFLGICVRVPLPVVLFHGNTERCRFLTNSRMYCNNSLLSPVPQNSNKPFDDETSTVMLLQKLRKTNIKPDPTGQALPSARPPHRLLKKLRSLLNP